MPVTKRLRIKTRLGIGGYLLSAEYEGNQYIDIGYISQSITERRAEDVHSVLSYTANAEIGFQYDTGYGLLGVSAEARYLSHAPFVRYIEPSTNYSLNYESAHLNYADAYSIGGNIEYKILF